MSNLDTEQPATKSQQADRLIREFAFGSSLTGLIPIPILDTLSLIGVQRYMLFRLSRLYQVPFKKNLAKIALTTLTSGVGTTAVSPMLGSIIKMVPGVGTMLGSATMATLSSASTYAVGKVFQQHFENGGTFESFDTQQAKENFDTELKKGKEIASKTKTH